MPRMCGALRAAAGPSAFVCPTRLTRLLTWLARPAAHTQLTHQPHPRSPPHTHRPHPPHPTPPPRAAEDIDFKYPLRRSCVVEIDIFCARVPHGHARIVRCLQVRGRGGRRRRRLWAVWSAGRGALSSASSLAQRKKHPGAKGVPCWLAGAACWHHMYCLLYCLLYCLQDNLEDGEMSVECREEVRRDQVGSAPGRGGQGATARPFRPGQAENWWQPELRNAERMPTRTHAPSCSTVCLLNRLSAQLPAEEGLHRRRRLPVQE